MNTLWTYIDQKNWTAQTKYIVISLLCGLLYALAGFVIWLVIRTWALSTADWMLSFIGCPFVIAWIVTYLHTCRHELHDGNDFRQK